MKRMRELSRIFYLTGFAVIIVQKASAFTVTNLQRNRCVSTLHFNGLEFDDNEDLNRFVDQRSLRMENLGINDDFVREEYDQWLAKYDKRANESRYRQFKKNMLQQLELDSTEGIFYKLNEFGDCAFTSCTDTKRQ
jgi:hypothetical protein